MYQQENLFQSKEPVNVDYRSVREQTELSILFVDGITF